MLTVQMPLLLALLGTALMAVAIFVPARASAAVTVSYAPPVVAPSTYRHREEPRFIDDDSGEATASAHAPDWPTLIDARAAGCDAAARVALADALGAVRADWARRILERALDDEDVHAVREAVLAALAGRD